MPVHHISDTFLTIDKVSDIIVKNYQITLSEDAEQNIRKCREYLDDKIATTTDPVYGINTGFGSLYKEHISNSELVTLQENIIKSHACGVGDPIPDEIVKLILLLKIQSLSYGHSGIQVSTMNRLIDMYNKNIFPVVYEYGSLGASGDLAPLAHLSLPLIGLGQVNLDARLIESEEMLSIQGWKSISLKPKEGLALLNGTQFMSAFGVYNVIHSRRLLNLANTIGALSIDAYDGRIEPFLSKVHALRPHPGQGEVAGNIIALLEGSEIIDRPKKHIQDPYSFRCIPQVHGATADTLTHVSEVITREINSVTDNPNVFPEDDMIISAGNFHGQPLALANDFLAIAIAELGSISERRTFQLISGDRDLPNYLIANPGINSGMMIPQYTAASLVSANKILCHPASVDSIVSSNGQEDHVSMGAHAAIKAYKVIDHVYSILAIELFTATQALELRKPAKTSPVLQKLIDNFRNKVAFVKHDRVLHDDISMSVAFLKQLNL